MNWQNTLSQLVKKPALHARFLNTLSLMEYIGARKIMKSQPEKNISRDILSHMVEEIRHAQIFKKMVLKMDPTLETYDDCHLLAGEAGRRYLQDIDRAVEERLGMDRPWENYLLSTLIIEERANFVYPAYEKILEPLGFGSGVRAILRDEEHHLQEIQQELGNRKTLAESDLEALRQIEEKAFQRIISQIQEALGVSQEKESPAELQGMTL